MQYMHYVDRWHAQSLSEYRKLVISLYQTHKSSLCACVCVYVFFFPQLQSCVSSDLMACIQYLLEQGHP